MVKKTNLKLILPKPILQRDNIKMFYQKKSRVYCSDMENSIRQSFSNILFINSYY